MEGAPQRGYAISNPDMEDWPRERLMAQGPDVLRNAELLAIILNTGYKDESVFELAARILAEYGSKGVASERNVSRLMAELGIPQMKASQIVACFELGRRVFHEDTARFPTIRGADDVYEYLKEMRALKKEVFRGLYLNIRNKLIHDEVISIGTLDANLVHPREVFQPAIEFSAAAVIISHNHPSGDPAPSAEDRAVTARLTEAGALLGIELLDHVIVAKDGFASCKE